LEPDVIGSNGYGKDVWATGILEIFGIISAVRLSRVQASFVIRFRLPNIFHTRRAQMKKERPQAHHPKAFSFNIIGNLAVLAAKALDPWFCVAIFR
jgi:hypothetical protein